MKDKLSYFDRLPSHFEKQIMTGLNHQAFILKSIGQRDAAFSYVIENDKSDFIAGVSGVNFYGCFYIDLLFVAENYRRQGYGAKLIHKAEELARQRECLFMAVNTMDFEAKPFYEQLGYEVEFERTGFEQGSSMFFMKKML
jgi:GNAT superfamily N-acetyltransferase